MEIQLDVHLDQCEIMIYSTVTKFIIDTTQTESQLRGDLRKKIDLE